MNRAARILLIAVVALVVLWALFTIVFPWVDRTFVTDPVVGTAGAVLARVTTA